MLATVEGIYRNGKVELAELPSDLSENTPAIVTFLTRHVIDLRTHGIDEIEATELCARLTSFSEDWDSPEMDSDDDYVNRALRHTLGV